MVLFSGKLEITYKLKTKLKPKIKIKIKIKQNKIKTPEVNFVIYVNAFLI